MIKIKKDKKGFTLIEIIVVIVILAVLMAVAVPSVLSYINEGDKAKYETAGRSVYIAVQTEYAKRVTDSKITAEKPLDIPENKLEDGITVTNLKYDAENDNISKVSCKIRINGKLRAVTIIRNKKVNVEDNSDFPTTGQYTEAGTEATVGGNSLESGDHEFSTSGIE